MDDCITNFKIVAITRDLSSAATHRIVLTLQNGQQLWGNINGPAYYNRPFVREMSFSREIHPSGQCVKRSDITKVTLVAGTYGIWYISSITTYIKVGQGAYQELTNDPNLNKGLQYPIRGQPPSIHGGTSTQFVLTLVVTTHTPPCGYETPVCECKSEADICVFNLEIDEIRTFTSYQKFPVGEGDGLFVRGAQGVVYSIGSDGKQKPLEQYESRECAKNFNSIDCSTPQFVDGKTYRMAIGVNGLIPGPTIIVYDLQKVVINVHNNLSSEGISIHWHGMHQAGTPWMDGVGQVTQCQIGPSSSFSYVYTASPSGTFWYHSHSGAQRTDGFYGALIVKEKLNRLNSIKALLKMDFEDLPGQHSISLLDWQHESSLDLFSQLHAGLGFYPEVAIGEVPPSDKYSRYNSTRSFENGEVGPVPYFSGLINGKGRHSDVSYFNTRLSVFTVERGNRYRFRLIGAQGLYAYKFSIDGHKLTVVGTDGYWIEPKMPIDYIIIHTGERYDFILEANATGVLDYYWIRAETLEIDKESNGGLPPYKSLGHTAIALLQYIKKGAEAPEVSSSLYPLIDFISKPRTCSSQSPCTAINCPFETFHSSYHTKCVNVHELRLLEETPNEQLPLANPPSDCTNCLHFINFNFEGDSETSSVNGRNFVLPPVPPQTQNDDFHKQAKVCSLESDCNPATLDCLCTHMIDIPYKKTVQFVLTALGSYQNAHPIHLHGHTFHVVHVGYPEYKPSTGFVDPDRHNRDISCSDCQDKPQDSGCNPKRCTQPSWTNNNPPHFTINSTTIRKDTVIVPAGGYVVINFISDNPGHWFLHCHIEMHQLEGMALIVNEAFEQQKYLETPNSINKCGDVGFSVKKY